MSKELNKNFYDFINMLESYIEETDMSQAEIARICGCSRSRINNIIKLRNNFQADLMLNMLDSLPGFKNKYLSLTEDQNSIKKSSKIEPIGEQDVKDKLIYFLEKEIEQLKKENKDLKTQCKKPVEPTRATV